MATHVVAFTVAAIAAFGNSGPAPESIVFLALIFADAGLLGLWAALGDTRWQTRLYAVAAALVLFWAAFLSGQGHVTVQDTVGFGLIISLPCAVIFVVFSLPRRGSRQLRLRRASDVPTREGFQFSLSGLLVVMTLVAIALSIGRVTRVMGEGGIWLRVFATVLIVPPSFVVVALATVWAALGIGRPLPRLLVVTPLAFVVGFASVFGFASDADPHLLFVWSCLTGITAIIAAASLLVVRSAGWRLASAFDEQAPLPSGAPGDPA